jgi:hypothetical protein
MIKLNSQAVQEIRQLSRAGFTMRSIACAYGVSDVQISNIARSKSWTFLAEQPIDLPILSHDQAMRLRLQTKSPRLTKQQQQIIEQYRNRLAIAIDASADREATAIALLRSWQPKRAKRGGRSVTINPLTRDDQCK